MFVAHTYLLQCKTKHVKLKEKKRLYTYCILSLSVAYYGYVTFFFLRVQT